MNTRTETEAENVVGEFLAAGNRSDVEAQLLLVTDDVRVEIPGMGVFEGKQEVKEYLEFGAGLGQETTMVDCRVRDATVVCDCMRRDDWLSAAGIPAFYFTYEFRVRRNRIASMRGAFTPHDAEIIAKTLEDWIPWAMTHYPELFAPDGAIRYSRETARGFVTAMEEWLRPK